MLANPNRLLRRQTDKDAQDRLERGVIDLTLAGKGNYVPARGLLIRAMWFFVEATIINNGLVPISRIRVGLLRLFGAKIGKNCRFLQAIRVKFPWNLQVGDNCWFGEDVWVHNQAPIRVGSNVCISQGAFLSSGSHDFADTMDLNVAPIVIEDGVWITSKCVVLRGVTIGRSSLITPLSVVSRNLRSEGVYGGNPCRFIKWRFGPRQTGSPSRPWGAERRRDPAPPVGAGEAGSAPPGSV